MLVLGSDEVLDGFRGPVGGWGTADEEDVKGWAAGDGMLKYGQPTC